MKKWSRGILVFLLAAVLLTGLGLPAFATEETSAAAAEPEQEFISIHTPEDLQAMAQNPSGNYVLAEDLDMTGIEWKPVDFSGVFDGAGHGILNLNLSQLGDAKAEAYDGNRKVYETSAAGLFGVIRNAEIRNLRLMNVRGVVEVDDPCFMGGLAGCSFDSTVTGCTVSGVLELRAHNQIFGLGGVIGYGSGTVHDCSVDVTLICVDTDSETKDEQFLGGVYSTGFMDVTNTNVKIQGFVSEHGYAHNGGIVGMYMQHPLGTGKMGYISYNAVSGRIKFFEDNLDRRAYCDAYAGEVLADRYVLLGNRREFTRDEVRTYDQELRPCMCEEPEILEYTVYSICAKNRYGYSNWECWSCGYQENYNYTMITHTVTNWEVIEAPTLDSEGRSEGICDSCGELQSRVEPMLVPVETEPVPTVPVPSQEPTEPEVSEEEVHSKISTLIVVLAIAAVVLVAVVAYLIYDLLRIRKK